VSRDEVSLAACGGLWRRTLLVATDGTRDTGTDVVWLQGPTGYVDSRGFAGTVTQAGDVFSWSREVDVEPTGNTDAGRMRWAADTLIETGVHDTYEEHWIREYGPAEPAGALLLSSGSEGHAVLVRVGDLVGWATPAGAVVDRVERSKLRVHGEHVLLDGVRWTIDTREGDIEL
jgi:hypothetical protein